MIIKKQYSFRFLIIICLIPTLILFNYIDLPSATKHNHSKLTKSGKSGKSGKKKKGRKSHHPKRHYNPSQTRAQAYDIIRSSSESISALAGLTPNTDEQNLKTVSGNSNQEEIVEGEEGENISELEAEDDVTVDIETFKMLWLSYVDDGKSEDNSLTQGGINKKEIMTTIMDWLGTPYRFGARSKAATDCSAFTQSIFNESCEVILPRTARDQFYVGMKVPSMNDLQFGDLVFFHTYSRKFASHVGIYLGDHLFAHASSRYGVTVSSLESTFYNNRFCGARRISMTDMVKDHNASSRLESNQ